jgi:hypothetical protein
LRLDSASGLLIRLDGGAQRDCAAIFATCRHRVSMTNSFR